MNVRKLQKQVRSDEFVLPHPAGACLEEAVGAASGCSMAVLSPTAYCSDGLYLCRPGKWSARP